MPHGQILCLTAKEKPHSQVVCLAAKMSHTAMDVIEPDHQENLELDDRTRAGTSWNAIWNGRVLRRDASDREREQAVSYRVMSALVVSRERVEADRRIELRLRRDRDTGSSSRVRRVRV
ncbi:hypothetical protein F2Q70_00037174 [Brassica cretica]|uniref:Uncharacterized protein n=1 Tax=Brassica cretica TaxID=69181 RepID=A0A8S9JU84_BRACR|nr:hypothetical protein F2Q68_00032527 [Brassica cretica]KAF2586130.1 hypothetical protein F2Q70_00037174 [Brassica cretica]